ncbi:MAG: hypothetical protein WKF86_07435, partial [Acidimicrobiales bacterium]
LEQVLGGPVDQAVGVSVAVRLPGKVEANAPESGSDGVRWELRMRERADLTAQSTAWNAPNLAAATVAILAALGLLALLVTRFGSRGRS